MIYSVSYSVETDSIVVIYVGNFGRIREEEVTPQALEAVFKYFMSKGLSFAEYCEYEAFGKTFRVSLVKEPIDATIYEMDCSGCGKPLKQYEYVYRDGEYICPDCARNGA